MHNRGNALFLILIAVALFAALSYAVTQSGRGGGSIDKEQESLYISEIAQYFALVESEVQKLRIVNGCSVAEISVATTDWPVAAQQTAALAIRMRRGMAVVICLRLPETLI